MTKEEKIGKYKTLKTNKVRAIEDNSLGERRKRFEKYYEDKAEVERKHRIEFQNLYDGLVRDLRGIKDEGGNDKFEIRVGVDEKIKKLKSGEK